MRYLTLKINPTTELSIDNSIWGKETIKLNGAIVSEKTSIWGSEHCFEVLEDSKEVTYKVIIKMGIDIRVTYLITRDGQEILNDEKESQKGIRVKSWVKSVGIVIWIFAMLATLRNGGSVVLPLALLPILLSFGNTATLVRNIDLTTSKSI
ncbi:hypothetical protein [Lacihabitans soyangensis]|uniref:Uncharacterized protein n=1 Tax=Lacihabitans soyangensis TaxID=869394 RepID=A0AAE3KSU3_9BACT|nr:hypothetical protein [Lacihabitans soyangensis]MCP9763448.1 hypothetical protein [Lacihabitans soyangensis]